MPTAHQQSFVFRTRGGARAGAGRKSTRDRPAIPHRVREEVRPYQPVHVTLRMAPHVWNLRSQRSFAVIHRAVAELRRRVDVRVVHFSILGNHIHLIVEADGEYALADGMRSFSIRLARGLNAMMGRRGPVFEDRYHAHALRTPAEVRNAVRYVLGNFANHATRWGERVSSGWVDPFTSAAARAPRSLWAAPCTSSPRTWLLACAATHVEYRRR